MNYTKNYYKIKLPYLSNSKINTILSKSMMSITPKITSISSLSCAMKTYQSVLNKKKSTLKIKHFLCWNKSSPGTRLSTIMISCIEILNLRTFLCHHIHLKLLILDLLSKSLILKRDKTIMLVHLSTCLMKLLMTIFTVLKVIFGPLVSFIMKCLLEELLGELKQNLTSKECSNLIPSKPYFHQKSLKSLKNFLLNHLLSKLKIECPLKKFSGFLKSLPLTLKWESNQKKWFQLLRDLHSEQEQFRKIQHQEIQLELNFFWIIISADLKLTKKSIF